jgi:hypothetical protein
LNPLPGPRTSRCFYLIARKEEHGDMPRQIAQICRSVLLNTVLPEIQTLIPWVDKDLFTIGAATDSQADA